MKPTDPAASHGTHGSTGTLENPEVVHEHSDVNVRAILTFVAALTVVTILVTVLMYGVFVVFERQAAANDPLVTPLAEPAPEMPATTTESPFFGNAPEPQLLTNEPAVLEQLREREEQQLGTYGWVDEQAGVARIPIERAKELIVERGLPVIEGRTDDPALGTNAPARGESSSGRVLR